MFYISYPTASATVYGRRPKFFRAEHSATAEGENCTYGPTLEARAENSEIVSLLFWDKRLFHKDILKLSDL